MNEHQNRTSAHETMTDGDWVYVLVTAAEGKALNYLYIGNSGLRLSVSSNQTAEGALHGQPSTMLARIKSKFVPSGEWEWRMYGN